ncbi:MAG TPA: hypothetical protein VMV92_41875 [Streptosporangiaceae bacterium]|nr:hypothetical protein [Streptosporangiaceae bacterium]
MGSGWDLEATLDVSMISAACPHCRILVVEAAGNSVASLARSEDTAARMGAPVISNSYGAREDGYSLTLGKAYDHPGHTIVASTGDYGYTAVNFPANLAADGGHGPTGLGTPDGTGAF